MPRRSKPKRGRPPLPAGEAKDKRLSVKFTRDEYARLQHYAKNRLDSQLSSWVRELLLSIVDSDKTPEN